MPSRWLLAAALPGHDAASIPRPGSTAGQYRRAWNAVRRVAAFAQVSARQWTLGSQEVSGMPRGSSPKRERQYKHIEASARRRGESNSRAKEIAARTVNKERARAGESNSASRTSTQDMSSSRRGDQRSHRGAQGPTYAQLYAQARSRGIKGRSSMNKTQLARALGR